jgi:hypothetical protein
MFTGGKCSWGLYHPVAISTVFDKEPLSLPLGSVHRRWPRREVQYDSRSGNPVFLRQVLTTVSGGRNNLVGAAYQ